MRGNRGRGGRRFGAEMLRFLLSHWIDHVRKGKEASRAFTCGNEMYNVQEHGTDDVDRHRYCRSISLHAVACCTK
jgi:hypothetical protein